MNNAKKPLSALAVAATLSMSLVMMNYIALTAAMNSFAEHFAGFDVSWIQTLPNLFIVIGTFIAGALIGKRLSCRTVALVGSALVIVAGCAPFFVDNYYFVIATRVFYGFGAGFLSPLANALILGNFDGDRQAKMLGYSTLFMNAGGIIMQLIAGFLAGISWNYAFLSYLFVGIGFVMAFFLPDVPTAPKEESAGPKEHLSKQVFVPAVLLGYLNMNNFAMMVNFSTLIAERGIGGPEISAIVLSMFSVAGVIGGAVFGRFFARASRFVFPLAWIANGLGAGLMLTATSLPVAIIATALVGVGFSFSLAGTLSWVGLLTPPSTIPAATSVVMAFMSLGSFLASFWLMGIGAIFGETVYAPFKVELIPFLIVGVIFLFYNPFKRAGEKEN